MDLIQNYFENISFWFEGSDVLGKFFIMLCIAFIKIELFWKFLYLSERKFLPVILDKLNKYYTLT